VRWRKSSPPPAAVSTAGISQQYDLGQCRTHRFGLPRSRWEGLEGRAFWVTGAATGYGRAISMALAAAGGYVILTGRRLGMLEQVLQDLHSLGVDTSRCFPVPADITDEHSVNQAVLQIGGRKWSLMGLVNNAAVPEPPSDGPPLASLDLRAWRQLFDTNVTGQWLVCKAALPLLSASESWRVLFMTSEAGWADTPGVGPYNVTKAALNSLGFSFAAECAAAYPNCDLQVNVLVPGEARTQMNRGSSLSPFAVVPMALALLSHPPGGPNGRFFHRDGRHLEFGFSPRHDRSLLVPPD